MPEVRRRLRKFDTELRFSVEGRTNVNHATGLFFGMGNALHLQQLAVRYFCRQRNEGAMSVDDECLRLLGESPLGGLSRNGDGNAQNYALTSAAIRIRAQR